MVTEHVGDLLIPPVRRDNSNDLVIEFNHAEPSPEGLYSLQGEESALFWFRVPGYVTTMGDRPSLTRCRSTLTYRETTRLNWRRSLTGLRLTRLPTSTERHMVMATQATSISMRARCHGRQTGRTLLGGHFNLDLKGFMLRSEYVHNLSFRAYPSLITTKLKHKTLHSNAFLWR